MIRPVKSRKDLKTFIRFPYILYKDCPNWVPALEGDEFDTLTPSRNAAFEYCEAQCFLCEKDGKVAGRVAAIINHNANKLWKSEVVRFGWLDFIEDAQVLHELLEAVAAWGIERGCDTMKGPLGFTDMDKEGLLVEGYDRLSPFTCLYNYPYYDTMLKAEGFSKDEDWLQKLLVIGPELPAKYQYAKLAEDRFGISIVKAKSMRELGKKYGMALFHMYNESFAPLFQFSPLSDEQIRRYLQTYIPILDHRYVAICKDSDGKAVGFAFCVPSLSKAVKKSGGKLFPFGWARILHALRHNDTLEALMIGVLPEYQQKGAALLLLKYIHENCISSGITRMIMNPQLETNAKVQTLWDDYENSLYMRRRSYTKKLV